MPIAMNDFDASLDTSLASLSGVTQTPETKIMLLSLLREDAPFYQGRGTTEVERLRGFILAQLSTVGLADETLPYIIEELETGLDAYSVGAAARAARELSHVSAETIELLFTAIERIRHVDEYVNFDSYPPTYVPDTKTAVMEAIATLAAAGPAGRSKLDELWKRASGNEYLCRDAVALLQQLRQTDPPAHSCCMHTARQAAGTEPPTRSVKHLNRLVLQNQNGGCTTFGKIFGGRAALIVFFYTRCMNPHKCSRSISNLAQLQREARTISFHKPPMLAGITYDDEFDTPDRLRRYGEERGLEFDDNCQLFRCTDSFELLRSQIQLGVGFGSATVNRHRIEMLLLSPAGNIAERKVRRLWKAHEVLEALQAIDRQSMI